MAEMVSNDRKIVRLFEGGRITGVEVVGIQVEVGVTVAAGGGVAVIVAVVVVGRADPGLFVPAIAKREKEVVFAWNR